MTMTIMAEKLIGKSRKLHPPFLTYKCEISFAKPTHVRLTFMLEKRIYSLLGALNNFTIKWNLVKLMR